MNALSNQLAPSPFESFNARTLEPQQVAQTFVPPDHYSNLLRRTHTLIIGPRGSGKTTLLKMLQAPALEAWKHPAAESFRRRIDFTGIFVPADVSWGAQIYNIGADELTPRQSRLLGNAAFTTHVLRALVSAINYRVHSPADDSLIPHRRATLTKAAEAELVSNLADAWHLRPPVRSLAGLRFSLGRRFSELHQLASKERLLGDGGRDERLADETMLHMDFLNASGLAIDQFSELAEGASGRWAFLFDELELAPRGIRAQLLRSLRSVDERFLFKLSLSPYSEDLHVLESALSAMSGHDYEEISLTYSRKEDGYAFCTALLRSMLEERGLPTVSANKVFGTSEFDTDTAEWKAFGTAYRAGSRLARRIVALAEKDKTFRSYLRKNGIDPYNLGQLEGPERAAELRKITALAAVRLEFRVPDRTDERSRKHRVRSRKTSALYRGASSLFAMVEGNPRLFIGIVSPLLDKFDGVEPVSAAHQSREISRAIARFRALLRTIPSSDSDAATASRGILSLIDHVGNFFFRETVVEEFNPDPPGSFVVDSNISDNLLEGLGKALNAGAIIYVPDPKGQMILSSLRGKRFRLAYLLAPHYQIPIRLGRQVSLLSILNQGTEEQPSLFSR